MYVELSYEVTVIVLGGLEVCIANTTTYVLKSCDNTAIHHLLLHKEKKISGT